MFVLSALLSEDGEVAEVKPLLSMAATSTESSSWNRRSAWTVLCFPDPIKFRLGRSLWRNLAS